MLKLLGIEVAVYRYPKGDSNPSIKHIKKLTKLFNSPESELLAMKGISIDISSSNEPTERDELEAELRELAKSFLTVFFLTNLLTPLVNWTKTLCET